MSNNAIIAYVNLADAGSVTASSQALLLPVSNLKVPHIARKWRGGNGTSDYFICDLGSSQSVDTLAVLGLTANQIRLRISSSDATGASGDLFDSGVVGVDQNYLSNISLLSAPVSGRYVRVDLTTTGQFVEAGRLFVGLRTQFAYNFIPGWQRMWTDLSTRTKTLAGQTQVFPRGVFRTYTVNFDFLRQADRDGFVETIDMINAMKVDVLFVSNPASTNLSRDSVWGLMTAISPVVQPSVLTFTKQYTIEERL
jgi:hypothetical protein